MGSMSGQRRTGSPSLVTGTSIHTVFTAPQKLELPHRASRVYTICRSPNLKVECGFLTQPEKNVAVEDVNTENNKLQP